MNKLKANIITIVNIIVVLAATGAIVGGSIGIVVCSFKLAYGVFV